LSTPNPIDLPDQSKKTIYENPEPTFFQRMTAARFSYQRSFEPLPPKEYVVDGFLARGEVSCFFGEPGASKGALAVDIACRVGGGLPWMGRGAGDSPHYSDKPEDWLPTGVLYVALERAQQVQRRVEAFAKVHEDYLAGGLDLAIWDGPLDLVGGEPDVLADIVRDVAVGSAVSQYAAGWDPFRVDLIVIDTLARTFGTGSDSDPEATAAVVRALERTIRKTGAHIMLIHHTPIGDDSRLRGHGNLLAAFDQTVRVQKLAGGSLATVIKDNDCAEDAKPSFAYRLESITTHTDERSGRVTTAPIVMPADLSLVKRKERSAPPLRTGKPKAASPSELPALSALSGLEGAVTEEAWRAAYDAGREEGVSEGAHRTRFTRAKESLKNKGLITLTDAGLWSIT
jgi:hypothetical protein